jgi:tetratricopeptide (TPR) repeat protein
MGTFWRVRVRRVAAVLFLASVLCGGGGAAAHAVDGALGAPWEAGIREGIEQQERERRRGSPDKLLRDARLAAARRGDETSRVVRLYLLARAFGIAGDEGSARSTYREVLEAAPRCYFAYHDLAMLDVQRASPNLPSAEQNLKNAVAINASYVTGWRKLAALYAEQKRVREAVGVVRRIVQLAPNDLQARFLLAQGLIELDDARAAEAEVRTLLGQEPRNPSFQSLHGVVLRKQGRYDESLAVFRRLARENPSAREPLWATIAALDDKRRQQGAVDVDAYVWAIENLIRLEREGEVRSQLQAMLAEIQAYEANRSRPRPEGPPTDAEIAEVLGVAPPEVRREALRYVYARPLAPEPVLLKEVMRRLGPATESDPEARAWSARVLARHGGYGLVGLLRHALSDPDPETARVAADALVALARTHEAARAGAILVLGLHAEAASAGLASAAREGVRELARADWPEAGDDEPSRRRAFRAWWSGPVGGEAQIRALAAFPGLGDRYPEDVLLPYLSSADPFVAAAAWRALEDVRPSIPPGPRADWFRGLPPASPDGFAAGAEAQTRARLAAWAAARPRLP